MLQIHWFRQDLRLTDNPALTAACQQGLVLPVYILDNLNAGEWAMGGASRWWLHHSLCHLNQSLSGNLLVLQGDPCELLPSLVRATGAQGIHWNRCYEPWRILRDTRLKEQLHDTGVQVESHNGSLLWEPWQALKQDGKPYQVFTPFWRRGCLQGASPRQVIPAPQALNFPALGTSPYAERLGESGIAALNLLPHQPWDRSMRSTWKIGEDAARQGLQTFLDEGLGDYKQGRNFPARPHVSRLSPHLHFGEISPHQIWTEAQRRGIAQEADENLECFLSELGWREFSYSLLYHHPSLMRKNLQQKFDHFPWQNDEGLLQAWQHGETGFPLIDAGMRELWQTGYMHNRVRMVTGSFLVKNLLSHWHHGEDWFWDCLVDADLAANSASWQWIAGCGADAAPYFRVFNPVSQSERFDPQGHYIRRYVPEIAALPDRYLHNPSAAPTAVLKEAGIVLGKHYPKAVVDLKQSREQALAAFKQLGSRGQVP